MSHKIARRWRRSEILPSFTRRVDPNDPSHVFADCPIAIDECALDDVPLVAAGAGHAAACLRQDVVASGGVVYGTSGSRVSVGSP